MEVVARQFSGNTPPGLYSIYNAGTHVATETEKIKNDEGQRMWHEK